MKGRTKLEVSKTSTSLDIVESKPQEEVVPTEAPIESSHNDDTGLFLKLLKQTPRRIVFSLKCPYLPTMIR